MTKFLDHLYLFSAIALAIYSQCIIRWRLGMSSDAPDGFVPKMGFVIQFLVEPWVLTSIAATFFAGVFWIVALTKFELNYAYPWMAMIFIAMTFLGAALFGESININKLLGTVLVTLGLVLVARS